MGSNLAEALGRPDDSVPVALAALGAGRPVLVAGGVVGRVAEGEPPDGQEAAVVLAGALAEPRWTAWMVRHTSGLLYAPLPGERADALELPPMVRRGGFPAERLAGDTAYTVSVDAAHGVGTGISATDRARTARVLADPASRPSDLTRPGHVLPLRAAAGGVLERAGHAETAVALCRLAGLPAVALTAELVDDAGELAHGADVRELGRRTELPVLEIAALRTHLLFRGDGLRGRVTRGATALLPTDHGRLKVIGYRDEITGAEHVALIGEPDPGSVPLVAAHVECLPAEVFGSRRCECALRLDAALARMSTEGGVVVYVRRTGTRHLVDAGLEMHARDHGDAAAVAAVLADLGLSTVRLLRGPITAAELAPGGITAAATVRAALGSTVLPTASPALPVLEPR